MTALDLRLWKKELTEVTKFVNLQNHDSTTENRNLQHASVSLAKLLKQIDDVIDSQGNESSITTKISTLSDNDFNSIMSDIAQVK